jgi:hypothetical protein
MSLTKMADIAKIRYLHTADNMNRLGWVLRDVPANPFIVALRDGPA